MSNEATLAEGHAALTEGRWADARAAYEHFLSHSTTDDARPPTNGTVRGGPAAGGVDVAGARMGLASALWWQGESHACIEPARLAYAGFRRAGEVAGAAQCGIWLAIAHKANLANFAAANGWLGRVERLLAPLDPGPLHGWMWVARAYQMTDLATAEALTLRAVDVARTAGDVDLELVALAQLGLVRVGQGHTDAGFALVDEALAAALAGEGTTLDTVVYTCCDMLNACELAGDVERAAQWCRVADDFAERYGCPFLYAECRILHGSVLAARGRWADAEAELAAGLRSTEGTCPGLHAKALVRLAELRVRQGRLEEAGRLLDRIGDTVEAETEEALARAALALAAGDAPTALRHLGPRLPRLTDHRLAAALDLLTTAHLTSPTPAANPAGETPDQPTDSAPLTGTGLPPDARHASPTDALPAQADTDRPTDLVSPTGVDLPIDARPADAASARRTADRLTELAPPDARPGGVDLPSDARPGGLGKAREAAESLAGMAGEAASARLDAMAAGAGGRVAAARGDVGGAEGQLEAALAGWARLGMPYEVARTRVELARLLAPTRPDPAVDHARRALAGFERLGAALDADRAAALLRSLGVNARTGSKGVGLLTEREQEVLHLLGAGLSNPEIAERLFVTRKTASHHVSSILTKLQLRNRSEAAVYAVSSPDTRQSGV